MGTETGANEIVTRTANRDQLTTEIVTAIAEVNDESPIDLDEKLHDVIDPDGLEMIFATENDTPSSSTYLLFTMAGCEVIVYGDGQIIVTPQVQTTESETGQFGISD